MAPVPVTPRRQSSRIKALPSPPDPTKRTSERLSTMKLQKNNKSSEEEEDEWSVVNNNNDNSSAPSPVSSPIPKKKSKMGEKDNNEGRRTPGKGRGNNENGSMPGSPGRVTRRRSTAAGGGEGGRAAEGSSSSSKGGRVTRASTSLLSTPAKTPVKPKPKVTLPTPKSIMKSGGSKTTKEPTATSTSSSTCTSVLKTPNKNEGSSGSAGTNSTSVWRFNSIGVPKCPVLCRESQFEEIWSFLYENVEGRNSRCMYVSGVPGTGKTLIVQTVVDCLFRYASEKKENLMFHNVYINGLSLGSPEKIWRRFYAQIEETSGSGKNYKNTKKAKLKPAVAFNKLNSFFESKGKRLPVVLVIDELDQLLDKKQSILYQLLEWTTKPWNMFSLIAIFNTMSLPENALVMRNSSRMGFVRCIFPPYSHEQLQTIVKTSLASCKSDKIKDEAILLVAKKVAAVSGDARRALEIARRAIEIVESGESKTGIMGVKEAFKEIFSSVKVDTIRHCSLLEQTILKLVNTKLQNTGDEITTLMQLFEDLPGAATFEVGYTWTRNQFLSAVTKLHMMKLLIIDNGNGNENSASLHRKVSLNVTFEDITYALDIREKDD